MVSTREGKGFTLKAKKGFSDVLPFGVVGELFNGWVAMVFQDPDFWEIS